ncbi:sulfite exporter TauE/SafE family protein [Candidatus Pelagadaptatus aseana]|uniref:sulfite exporter TauE/SafE family protein n=1 Tax=Candidatus Pelagadaptatus aseana TaxID=3120508 RepID=UPI003C6F3F84
MSILSLLLIFAVVGVVAGLIAGLFGLGGGVVIVPALIYTFAGLAFPETVATHLAVGTSLGCIVVTSLTASRTHWKKGAVDLNILGPLVPGVLVGGWCGGLLASLLAGAELQLAFAAFLVFVGFTMLKAVGDGGQRLPGIPGRVLAGTVIGSLSSLFGIGGGSLTVPFLRVCQVPMAKAVATSAALGLPIAVAGVASFIYQGWGQPDLPDGAYGYFYLPAFLGIVVFSAPASRIGARMAHNLPAEKLQKGFAVVLFLIAVELFVSGLM